MSDMDTRLLEEAYENIFSGITDDGEKEKDKDEDKEDDESCEDCESCEEKEDSDEEESDESDEEDSDEDKDEESEEDSDDEESEESDESEESEEDDDSDEDGEEESEDEDGDVKIQNKVKQLQKQYNDILVDAFGKYAPEAIENALEGSEGSFGQDVESILNAALEELRSKILADLGIETAVMAPADMGGVEFDLGAEPEIKFGSEIGGIPTIEVGAEEDIEEDEEDEKKNVTV